MNSIAADERIVAPQPILETDRLLLRPLALADAGEVQRLCGDFAVADTTLNIPHPYPDGAAEEFISAQKAKYEQGDAAVFAITLKSNGTLVGGMGLNTTKRFRRAELGYWIGKPYWNQGLATEAGRAVVNFGFTHWSLHKIESHFLVRNPASGRVLQKIGFVEEGFRRDHVIKWDRFEDVIICGIIKT